MDSDTDQVATPDPESLGQASHTGTLLLVDCVEGMAAAGEGANFDNNRRDMVASYDVDFTTGDNHVARDDVEALFLQVETGEELAELSGRQPS